MIGVAVEHRALRAAHRRLGRADASPVGTQPQRTAVDAAGAAVVSIRNERGALAAAVREARQAGAGAVRASLASAAGVSAGTAVEPARGGVGASRRGATGGEAGPAGGAGAVHADAALTTRSEAVAAVLGIARRVDAASAAADPIVGAGAGAVHAGRPSATSRSADAAVHRVRPGVGAKVLTVGAGAAQLRRLTVHDASAVEADVSVAAHVAAHAAVLPIGGRVGADPVAALHGIGAIAASDRAGESVRTDVPARTAVGGVTDEAGAAIAAVDQASLAHRVGIGFRAHVAAGRSEVHLDADVVSAAERREERREHGEVTEEERGVRFDSHEILPGAHGV